MDHFVNDIMRDVMNPFANEIYQLHGFLFNIMSMHLKLFKVG